MVEQWVQKNSTIKKNQKQVYCEAFNYKFVFSHAGIAHGNQAKQLQAFSASLASEGFAFSKKPNNWIYAFSILRRGLEEGKKAGKKVIFLDELSWMASSRKGFVSALEYFWNSWASGRKDICLIVSASATSWLLDNVVHNKGGLYNRLTHSIGLEPFSLAECEEYAKKANLCISKIQILETYMVFGGVPFYWSLLEKGKSVPQNIDCLFFSSKGSLRNEFDYLYASLFNKPDAYIKIVTALGKKKAGMSRQEILSETKLDDTGNLTKKLKELSSCGFIREYLPFGKEKKGSIFQLIDLFSLFYFRFMERMPSDENFFENSLQNPAVNTWHGLSFERVCLINVNAIKKSLGISGVATSVCSWSIKKDEANGIDGHQIDLLIVRKDQIINMCEMKYGYSPYVITKIDDDNWRTRKADFAKATKTNSVIHLTLVSPFGCKENSHSKAVDKLIRLDDLFM